MAELKTFKLPDVGEGLTEADIVKWHVQPGDEITINQIIVEIETAKALVELPSPYEGVVASLLVPEGQSADVGTPIIAVQVGSGPLDGAETADPALITAEPGPVEGGVEPGIHGTLAPKEVRQAVLVGYGVKTSATKRRPRRPAAQAEPAPARASATAPAAGTGNRASEKVLAKPPVRKLAKDLGIDLTQVSGTGEDGRITREDVQTAAAFTTEVPVRPVSPAPSARISALPREERIPIRGVRKHMAAAMVSSAFTVPHVTEFLQIDITETMSATARLKQLPDFEGVRVSPLLLVAKALLIAAGRNPMINSAWDEAGQEIVVRHYVNLGIAAATERGLIVPSVKDAHAMSLPELGRAIGDLTETARAGKSSPADLSGGTITITNVGVFGVDTGTPIITPGEAAILAFGQVKDTPWVVDGQLAVRKACTLALSFDHRIIDGATGSAVLSDVGAMLTDPLHMLAWS
jgi:2-oxoisovalerate dehydrogenase E2 component (dihydrolipoyl transacylase)